MVVAVSNRRPPCFQNVEEQADCPEIQRRRGTGGEETLLTMMCGPLVRSLAEYLERAAIEAVDREGVWQISCRIPGNTDIYYSPVQARGQAEIWDGCGRSGLANRFHHAANQADHGAFRSRRRKRRPIPILALSVVVAVACTAWFLLTGQPADVAMQSPAPAAPAAETASTAAQTRGALAAAPLAIQGATAPAAIGAGSTVQAATPPELAAEPEMVSIPGGTFSMGSELDPSEAPIHTVAIKPFAISKFPVTVRAWIQCVAAKVCSYVPTDEDDDAPVTNLSFNDAQQFVAWLARATQTNFRLPSEAEWEYAARGGTRTKYWWGDDIQPGMANCKGCNGDQHARQTAKAGDIKPNPFGLYDMGGGVAQWVADCWHKNYQGAAVDGSAWVENDCVFHVIRSGSWRNDPSYVRTASRDYYEGRFRYPTHGLRIARSL